MAWDWDYVSANTGEFTQYGVATKGGLFAYPQLSKELLQRAKPDWVFRRYINKVTDFSKGKGEYILFNRLTSSYNEIISGTTPLKDVVLNEFDPVPNVNISVKRFSIKVSEWGVGMPLTERLQVMATYDAKAVVDMYLRNLVVGTIDAKIVWNAIGLVDIIAKKTSTSLSIIEGTGLKGGTVASESGYPITVSALDVTGDTAGNITIQDILTVKAEMIKRRMKQHSSSVICNTTFFQSVFADTSFMQIVAYSRPERMEQGELGSIFGFRFVVDNSGFLDKILSEVTGNSTGIYKSIAVFLGDDGIREAIALPEEIRSDTPLELGRFTRIGAVTYRGESPTWFTADADNAPPKQGAGIVLIGK